MLLGFTYACIAAITYGTIALFSVPSLQEGFSYASSTFYRFLFSAIMIFLFALMRKKSLRIYKSDVPKFAAVSFFYVLAALSFVAAFNLMDSGIVGTVQFCYPIFVILAMTLFFGEKFYTSTAVAAFFILLGIGIFSVQNIENVRISMWGMIVTIFSAITMALYVLGIQVARFQTQSKIVVCAYILLFAAIFAGVYAAAIQELQWITTKELWKNLLLLAFVSTAISNTFMIFAVQLIGPSLTSIFNGLEPLTVMIIGIIIFGESLTWNNVLGSICIIGAVGFVALRSHMHQKKALSHLT